MKVSKECVYTCHVYTNTHTQLPGVHTIRNKQTTYYIYKKLALGWVLRVTGVLLVDTCFFKINKCVHVCIVIFSKVWYVYIIKLGRLCMYICVHRTRTTY